MIGEEALESADGFISQILNSYALSSH
jgi:hypothetical protein